MSTNGKYFNFPTTAEEHLTCWNEADVITPYTVPAWMEEPGDYRYVSNSTWAYLSQSEQEGYFAEIEALADNDFIVTDGDMGDGCVTHFYVKRPESCEPDTGCQCELIVGNVGTVYFGDNVDIALMLYFQYVEESKQGVGLCGNEPVTLFADNDILMQYMPESDGDYVN